MASFDDQFSTKLSLAENSSGSVHATRELLSFMRSNKIRRSEIAVKFCRSLIENHAAELGNELWAVYEQAFVASLDTDDRALAAVCLKALVAKFPDSARVRRLVGMDMECCEEYKDALDLFKEMTKENPVNAIPHKRGVAMLRAQGKLSAAVVQLNEYLTKFPTDADAWQELAELHEMGGNYRAASFCMEEVLLSNPMSFAFHCKLAELYYTAGGPDNIRLARKHFAQSLDLKKNGNTRASIGIAMCAYALATTKGGKPTSMNQGLFELAGNKLRAEYMDKAPELFPIVDAVLNEQATVVGSSS